MSKKENPESEYRYLVLGASGVLGSRLFEFMKVTRTVAGTYFTRRIPGCIQCDLTDPSSLRRVMEITKPDVILHAAGMTRPDQCEANKDTAHRVNVDGIRFLAKESGDAKILFFSTDYVFNGAKGRYSEDDIPCPINYYGKTKLEAERVLLDLRPDCVIARVAGLFGISRWNREFFQTFTTKKTLMLSGDHISSYTYIDDICRVVPLLCSRRGILHVVGPDSFSRAEFGRLACSYLGINAKVVPIPGTAAYPSVPRPLNSSLVSNRLKLAMTPIRSALLQIRNTVDNI